MCKRERAVHLPHNHRLQKALEWLLHGHFWGGGCALPRLDSHLQPWQGCKPTRKGKGTHKNWLSCQHNKALGDCNPRVCLECFSESLCLSDLGKVAPKNWWLAGEVSLLPTRRVAASLSFKTLQAFSLYSYREGSETGYLWLAGTFLDPAEARMSKSIHRFVHQDSVPQLGPCS